MKSYLALTWKELKAQKITAILILIAVIMSTIMTTVVGQSIGILQSMRMEQAAGRDELIRRYADSVDGVIYHTVQFCDNYAYEYAWLKRLA